MKNFLLLIIFSLSLFTVFSQRSDSASYYFKKGIEEKNAKRFALAEKNLNKSIEFSPEYVEAYVENGKVNLEMRKISDAQKNFTKAYELEPSNPEVIKELAQLYFNNRQFQKAIELAQKCNTCTDADRILGMSYYQTEDYGKAQNYLLRAIAKNDKDAESAYTLGRTYLELENEQNAIPQFKKAITIEPSRNVWMYELGLIHYNQNDFKNALKYFNMAADAGYTKANDFYENYGFAQVYTGDAQNGVKTLTEVLNKKPNNKELLNNIANAMYETKRYDDALVYFQKLLELNPKDASSLFMAGMVFQKKGQKEKGQKICDKAIEMDPSLARNRQKQELPMGL
ncbi:MAG: tetratricopeptide repeat protein [Ginsengibacter sp.]